MAGKAGIGALDTPEMQHARQQREIRSEKAYREKYEKEMRGRAAGALDTPEMRRIKKVQSQVSDKKYRKADFAHQASLIDTPEMRRIKQASKQSSDIAYKNEAREISARVTSAVMDTPFMNTVKRNTQNVSSVHYKKPLEPKSAACLDMVSQRACQVAKMQSNVSYRGIDSRRDKMESIRESAVITNQLNNMLALLKNLEEKQLVVKARGCIKLVIETVGTRVSQVQSLTWILILKLKSKSELTKRGLGRLIEDNMLTTLKKRKMMTIMLL